MNQNINKPHFLFIRNILKLFVKYYLHVFAGYRITGKENLPKKGPAIVMSNHAAFVDSLYFICSIPSRFVICGAKPKYFNSVKKRILLGIANILKVETREQFEADCH